MQKRRKEYLSMPSRLRPTKRKALAEEGSYLATHRSPCCGRPLGRNDASREPSGKCFLIPASAGREKDGCCRYAAQLFGVQRFCPLFPHPAEARRKNTADCRPHLGDIFSKLSPKPPQKIFRCLRRFLYPAQDPKISNSNAGKAGLNQAGKQ